MIVLMTTTTTIPHSIQPMQSGLLFKRDVDDIVVDDGMSLMDGCIWILFA